MPTKNQYTYATFLENAKQIQNTVQLNAELELLQKSTKSYLKRFEDGDVDGMEGFEDMPLYSYFGVNPRKYTETSIVPLREFDAIIQNMMPILSHDTFEKIWSIFLPDMYHNFRIILSTVKEIIARKDGELQILFVQQFLKAMKYYDGGHRYWEKTVQDQLIDTYFGKFEAEPLYLLLEKVDEDCLNSNGGDGMDTLFVPAFHRSYSTTPSVQKRWEHKFLKHLSHVGKYQTHADLVALIDNILPHTSSKFQWTLQKIKQLIEYTKEGNPESIQSIIHELGKKISAQEYSYIETELLLAISHVPIPYDALEQYLNFLVENPLKTQDHREWSFDEILIQLFILDPNRTLRMLTSIGQDENLPEDFWRKPTKHALIRILSEPSLSDRLDPESRTNLIACGAEILDISYHACVSEIIGTALERLIDGIYTYSHDDEETNEYREYRDFIQKNQSDIRLIGNFWENTRKSWKKVIADSLDLLRLNDETEQEFLGDYFSELILSDDEESFVRIIQQLQVRKKQSDMISKKLSERFSDIMPFVIEYNHAGAKKWWNHIKLLSLQSIDFQKIQAALLWAMINENDISFVTAIIDEIPKLIEYDKLAYQVARYYAKKKDIEHLLIAVSRAIELGKTEDQFLNDPDFDAYKTDPSFLQAIKEKK